MLFDVYTHEEAPYRGGYAVATLLGGAFLLRWAGPGGAGCQVADGAACRGFLRGGLPGTLRASGRRSGRLSCLARLAALPERVLPAADHPHGMAGADHHPPQRTLDTEQ